MLRGIYVAILGLCWTSLLADLAGTRGAPGCYSCQRGVHSGEVANILEKWDPSPPLFALHPIRLGPVASHRNLMFAPGVTYNYSLSIFLQASGSYVMIDRGQMR